MVLITRTMMHLVVDFILLQCDDATHSILSQRFVLRGLQLCV